MVGEYKNILNCSNYEAVAHSLVITNLDGTYIIRSCDWREVIERLMYVQFTSCADR